MNVGLKQLKGINGSGIGKVATTKIINSTSLTQIYGLSFKKIFVVNAINLIYIYFYYVIMISKLYEDWYRSGLLSEGSLNQVKERESNPMISVHWDIKTLLYLGVLLLSGGLGIVIYKNIDSIGHVAILAFLAVVCLGCFYYCFMHASPFSRNRIKDSNALQDYTLLLACLTFISCIGYLQFQFDFFGNRYGLASFTTLVVLLFSAYYFDHIGVLSLAITNLAAWLGITVTPLTLLKNNDFNNSSIIFTGIFLGSILFVCAHASKRWYFKKHFEFTYFNFAIHSLFISLIAAMFHFEQYYLLWFLLLCAFSGYCYLKAKADRSFYLVLTATLYTYFAIGYVIANLLMNINSEGLASIYLGLMYFIISGVTMVLFLIRINKKLKSDDSL